jgi:hypothetical protein
MPIRPSWKSGKICALKSLLSMYQTLLAAAERYDSLDLRRSCEIKILCQALGSREVLVNLVNLIDHRLSGVPVIRFKNYRAFHKYTIEGRIYSLKSAKNEGFIKALLRKL